jgi:hypothetical protein
VRPSATVPEARPAASELYIFYRRYDATVAHGSAGARLACHGVPSETRVDSRRGRRRDPRRAPRLDAAVSARGSAGVRGETVHDPLLHARAASRDEAGDPQRSDEAGQRVADAAGIDARALDDAGRAERSDADEVFDLHGVEMVHDASSVKDLRGSNRPARRTWSPLERSA